MKKFKLSIMAVFVFGLFMIMASPTSGKDLKIGYVNSEEIF